MAENSNAEYQATVNRLNHLIEYYEVRARRRNAWLIFGAAVLFAVSVSFLALCQRYTLIVTPATRGKIGSAVVVKLDRLTGRTWEAGVLCNPFDSSGPAWLTQWSPSENVEPVQTPAPISGSEAEADGNPYLDDAPAPPPGFELDGDAPAAGGKGTSAKPVASYDVEKHPAPPLDDAEEEQARAGQTNRDTRTQELSDPQNQD